MNSLDLIESANILLQSCRGRPSQISLRRASSSAYYAMFHCLAKNCADRLMGVTGASHRDDGWLKAYRSLNHGSAKIACKDRAVTQYTAEIQDFANIFIGLQEKRHDADYNPAARFTKSGVTADIELRKRRSNGSEARRQTIVARSQHTFFSRSDTNAAC